MPKPDITKPGYQRNRGECRRGTCTNLVSRRGLCKKHYRWARETAAAQGVVGGIGYVDTTETIAHMRKLSAAGLGYKRIAELADLHHVSVSRVHKQKTVTVNTAVRILGVPVPAIAHLVARDGAFVDATGTCRRVRALVADGHDQIEILAWIQEMFPEATLDASMITSWVLMARPCVMARSARMVAAVFDAHHMTRGTSVKAIRRGQRNGWALPMAWDPETIDDPNATPAGLEYVSPYRVPDDFADIIADHRALGRTDADIAGRLGLTLDGLQQRYRRAEPPIPAEVTRHGYADDEAVAS